MNAPASPASAPPLRVLVADDSAVARELLRAILEAEPGIVVVAAARDGEEAVRLAAKHRPDVVTMDIHMPRLNGFEATREIMHRHPTPIVVISGSSNTAEVNIGFQAMTAGAVAVLQRPHGVGHPAFEADARALVRTVRAMAEVKVVRRWQAGRSAPSPASSPRAASLPREIRGPIDIVAIGSSTGGPVALQTILSRLPAGLPFPLVIVQHMTEGFMPGFADWLARSAPFPVRIAAHQDKLLPGHAYLAPDGTHLAVARGGRIQLLDTEPERGLRPSVGVFFRSVASVYGSRSLAVLLTGMGVDGAAELKQLRELGAATVAQDRASCVVFGMPGAAIKLGGASWILPPEEIAALLARISNNDNPMTEASSCRP
jgi:Chemotaxis response regulator containing a CheY-like receiver domain and a methylesterase domain